MAEVAIPRTPSTDALDKANDMVALFRKGTTNNPRSYVLLDIINDELGGGVITDADIDTDGEITITRSIGTDLTFSISSFVNALIAATDIKDSQIPATIARDAEVAAAYATLSGATFTGRVSGPDPSADSNFATKAYVDAFPHLSTSQVNALIASYMFQDSQIPGTIARDAEVSANYARLTGAVFTGAVSGIDPRNNSDFATKRYVDSNPGGVTLTQLSSFVAGARFTDDQIPDTIARDAEVAAAYAKLSGATFTGAVAGLTPTADAHFATKKYVDDNAGGGGGLTRDQVLAIVAGASITDGQLPATITRDTELSAYALLAGATFTGAVSGITPTANAHFATKAYVDANAGSGGGLNNAQVNALIAAAQISDAQIASTIARDSEVAAAYAALSGATFTGAVSGITPTADANFATKKYVDDNAGSGGGLTRDQVNALIAAASISDTQIPASIARDSEVSASYAALAGAVFTGAVSGLNPTQDAHFATKSYVDANAGGLTRAQVNGLIAAANIADSQIASTIARDSEVAAAYAALSGATFTGAVSGIAPTADSHFATKQYVDMLPSLSQATIEALIAAASIADSQIASTIARDSEVAAAYAALTGATFTGAVAGVAPTEDAHFATKQYVDMMPNLSRAQIQALIAGSSIKDSQIASTIARDAEIAVAYAALTGATFTGAVAGIAPTADTHFATKQYVDSRPVGQGAGLSIAEVNQLIAEAAIADSQIASTIARDSEVAAAYAALSGATFTGAVSGITPTADANFATKKYVDDNAGSGGGLTRDQVNALIASANIADSQIAGTIARDSEVAAAYAALAGATFTGAVSGIDPTADANFATKKYVDDNAGSGGVTEARVNALIAGASIADSQLPASITRDTELAAYALLAGATFTGAVSGPTPTANAHLATKQYVDGRPGGLTTQQVNALIAAASIADGQIASTIARDAEVAAAYAALAGATFTGAVSGIAPTANANFTTKEYVDDAISGVSSGGTTPVHHSQLLGGTSADSTPTAAELTIVPTVAGQITILAYAGTRHQLLARRASDGDISSAVRSDDPTSSNLILGFTKYSSNVTKDGTAYGVWVSNQLLSNASDVTWTVG